MLNVYCDTGGYRHELNAMEEQGQIRVVTFKYENKSKKIKHQAAPSLPTWKELHYAWEELDGTWDDFGKFSNKRKAIEQLLGQNNLLDVKHLDSAYMSGCQVFLTSDKDDLTSRRAEIEKLLGIKVFHVLEDWQEFLRLICSENIN